MLTIFGKKKKDGTSESNDQTGPEAVSPPVATPITPTTTSAPSPSHAPVPMTGPPQSRMQNRPQWPPPMQTSLPQPVFRASPNAPLPAEETSLTKLLQSLLADIPLPPDVDSSFNTPQTTPDFVPMRSTPPSRPMVISQGKDSEDWEEQEQTAPKQSTPPAIPASKTKQPDIQTSPSKVPTPAPTVSPKKDQPPEKAPAKVEKQPDKPSAQAPPRKEPRSPQGFDHIFQLTQGNLENRGLVIINGEAGSGRTTLCSGLTSNYMKTGNACLYLTCDQSPSALRDQMKKIGTDAAQYESGFRLIIVDGFSSQSDSFSMEMYYVDQPFNFDTVTDALTRSSGMFVGEKVRIIFDSMDNLAGKVPSKDFAKAFTELVNKLKDSGSTIIATVDMSKLPKDLTDSFNDLAECVIDLSKDDSDPNGRELKVQRLNHSSAKLDAETFEIDANKGLVFV